MKNAICIIERTPNLIWLEFLSSFELYDTYVVLDDNTKDYSLEYQTAFPQIHFVQIDNEECEKNGFLNMNYLIFKKNITGWEKALLYFSGKKEYDNVWFFEDDVFFYSEHTVKNIDTKFPDTDVLTAPYHVSHTGREWWWPLITINYNLPYYKAMVCGVRVSRKLLSSVSDYAAKNQTLFFLESLFSTLAFKSNLSYGKPKEMIQIYFKHKWDLHKLNKHNMFHPVKNIELHKKAREIFSRNHISTEISFQVTNFFSRLNLIAKQQIKNIIKIVNVKYWERIA
jgi:hypothetical protein